jgi:nicotinamide mononucleotide transporter
MSYLCQQIWYMEVYMEIFTLVTGILYIVLEIMQKNLMWVVGIVTAAAACVVFSVQGLYASMSLNVYYVLVSFWGLYCWLKDASQVKNTAEDSGIIHLRRLKLVPALISLGVFALCFIATGFLMQKFGDSQPWLDAAVTVASAIATYWLTRSYIEQWLVWILADAGTATMCWLSGQYWLVALYAAYSLSAFYGYAHWKKKGIYLA